MATGQAMITRSRSVPAVARAAGILRALGNGQGEATLTDLARVLRIHKSTAHGILATLARHGFVERDPATRRYRLGRTLAALGRAAADRQDLGALARPHLARLCRLSGETATLHLRAGEGSVILASAESPHELKVTAPPGHRLPAFAGAVAKVLRAFGGSSPEPLPSRLPEYTPRTITDPQRYLEELQRVRRAGVAYDEMEYLPGVRAISAPVFRGRAPSQKSTEPPARSATRLVRRSISAPGGPSRAEEGHPEAVGALSIVGVAARISPAELHRLAGPLLSAARALSTALHPGPDGDAASPGAGAMTPMGLRARRIMMETPRTKRRRPS